MLMLCSDYFNIAELWSSDYLKVFPKFFLRFTENQLCDNFVLRFFKFGHFSNIT